MPHTGDDPGRTRTPPPIVTGAARLSGPLFRDERDPADPDSVHPEHPRSPRPQRPQGGQDVAGARTPGAGAA
ncbi:hypothetical protein NKH77_37455 [Streptomyces sp. M19]